MSDSYVFDSNIYIYILSNLSEIDAYSNKKFEIFQNVDDVDRDGREWKGVHLKRDLEKAFERKNKEKTSCLRLKTDVTCRSVTSVIW